jgi:antirestriction protein ArdC
MTEDPVTPFEILHLLAFQDCSQVASFKKWKEFGRNVKKGEKAKMILAPTSRKIKTTDEESGEEIETYQIIGYKMVPVFDISQTDGDEVKRGMTTKSEISFDHVLQSAQSLGTIVEKKPLEITRGGHISGNRIVLNSNLSEIENIGTLIHELAHYVLGHVGNTEISKEAKEQEAETVTALICAEFGIDRQSEFYLKGWGTQKIINAMPKMAKAYSQIKAVLTA